MIKKGKNNTVEQILIQYIIPCNKCVPFFFAEPQQKQDTKSVVSGNESYIYVNRKYRKGGGMSLQYIMYIFIYNTR